MAKIDEIKEFIGFLKSIFITLLIIDTSLIAWIFKIYFIKQKNIDIYGLIVIFVILFLIIILILLFQKILKEIKKLKDL